MDYDTFIQLPTILDAEAGARLLEIMEQPGVELVDPPIGIEED